MQYEVLYDVLLKPFDSWGLLLAGAIVSSAALILLLPCGWLPATSVRRVHSAVRSTISYAGVAIMLVFGIALLGGAGRDYLQWSETRELAIVGPRTVVEGPLAEASSRVQRKAWRESLRVGDIRFDYADNDAVTPFPLLRGTRALAKGLRVRLTHVNGRLVKVEAPLCRQFERCEVSDLFGVRTEIKR